MTYRKQFVVIGAGGFGQEVIWAARNVNTKHPTFDIIGYCDDDRSKAGQEIYGQHVLGSVEEVDGTMSVKPAFVCAIGNNAQRAEVVRRAVKLGWIPVTVIDPSVIVAEGVTVGEGTYVGAGTTLSPYATIGDHVIINHQCSIGHNSVLENFVQVSPGGRVSGGSVLKEGAFLASNAVVAPGRSVGRYATVGACSFAMTDIPDAVTAIGIPARITMNHS